MSRPLELVVELGARRYPIRIGRGLLDQPACWRDLIAGSQVLVVSNETVAPWYLARVREALRDKTLASLLLPDGEAHKTLDTVARVFDALAAMPAHRDVTVLALGGGVVGDVAGFAAACWMRGVAYVQVPTSLLAMVDSSVGGKTGVNLAQGKNLIGAFHQPRAVVIDTDTLATLPPRELNAGFAEVVKYGAIGDPALFAWLEAHAEALRARDPALLAQAIAACCRHKAAIVVRDETEQGERALLNFGHTFGHALESVTGYGVLLHGEAVAIGMCLAAHLSSALGRAPLSDAERLAALLARFDLPTTLPSGIDADTLLASLRLDKKHRSGRLRFILWRGVGRAELVDAPDLAAIRAVLG